MGVMIKEFYLFTEDKDIYTKVAIFKYIGIDDPVIKLDDAINQYTTGFKRHEYTEFVDMNMDNHWVTHCMFLSS